MSLITAPTHSTRGSQRARAVRHGAPTRVKATAPLEKFNPRGPRRCLTAGDKLAWVYRGRGVGCNVSSHAKPAPWALQPKKTKRAGLAGRGWQGGREPPGGVPRAPTSPVGPALAPAVPPRVRSGALVPAWGCPSVGKGQGKRRRKPQPKPGPERERKQLPHPPTPPSSPRHSAVRRGNTRGGGRHGIDPCPAGFCLRFPGTATRRGINALFPGRVSPRDGGEAGPWNWMRGQGGMRGQEGCGDTLAGDRE